MEENDGLEPFSVAEAASDLLDVLNADVLGFQHAVVHLQPCDIQNAQK